ncbi:hypothetical protein A2U01_0086227, partial [Trifolium medium]|nr:hypothetical protein [Trifolium medium]
GQEEGGVVTMMEDAKEHGWSNDFERFDHGVHGKLITRDSGSRVE